MIESCYYYKLVRQENRWLTPIMTNFKLYSYLWIFLIPVGLEEPAFNLLLLVRFEKGFILLHSLPTNFPDVSKVICINFYSHTTENV